MAKFLVLGSAGQIGKPLVTFLAERGHTVKGWDIKNSPEQDLTFANVGNPFISDMKLEDAIQGSDFVYFLAWDVGGSKYLSRKEYTYDFINNNMLIMQHVFAALKRVEKPFVFASSQMALMSSSPYGNTKLLGEKMTVTLGGIASRLWNVYGIEKELEKRHVVSDFIIRASKYGELELLTNGQEQRQFLYVDDCCEALYVLYEYYDRYSNLRVRKPIFGSVVDVSSGIWNTVEDVAKIVAQEFNCSYRLGEGPGKNPFEDWSMAASLQWLPEEERGTISPNLNFIKSYWNSKTSLEEGIKCIIQKMKDSKLI